MAPEKAPAFQWYPKDFLTDENVRRMCHTERGIYITLLSLCWLHGSLPALLADLAPMVDVPTKRFGRLWTRNLVRCFREAGGRLYHKRLDEEREKQETHRQRQSDKGKLGGRPMKAESKPEESRGFVEPKPEQALRSSSPISDLRSPQRATLSQSASEALTLEYQARAGHLVERYGELFQELRRGARYHSRPALDWQDACSLVKVWDDGRLEKLARVVLTTDDEWIARTDRGFKIFALKASWADDRLRSVESQPV